MTGRRESEEPQLMMVPCRMDQRDRLIAHILRNNSENTLLTVPMITVSHPSLEARREDVQSPTHVDTRLVAERGIVDGAYTESVGNRYMVERLMPRPFTMKIQVDIWTSNLDQKHQLMEQILTVIYPAFTIQNSENPLDWSARTDIEVEDITWTSRSVPVNTEEIDVATINLRMPFWLSPPAKVTHQKIIKQIVTNVRAGNDIEQIVTNLNDESGELLDQGVVTPGNHQIRISGNEITLLNSLAADQDGAGNVYSWTDLLNLYGVFQSTTSQIRLKVGGIESDVEIVGTLQKDVNRPNVLFWTIDPDTLPTNSFAAVDAIIDPMRSYPGTGLPAAINGQRYLIVGDIGPSLAWGSLSARANDIIQYQSGSWAVVFDSVTETTIKHVVNLHSGRQLRWTGSEWILSIDGVYSPGFWRIHL